MENKQEETNVPVPTTDVAAAEEAAHKTWADDDEDAGSEDDDTAIGGSNEIAPVPVVEEVKVYEKIERARNLHGDFVVTKINVKEREIPVAESDEEESSEEEESDEPEEEKKEEVVVK